MRAISQKWLIFIGAAIAVIMVDVDMTAINIAVEPITRDLGLSISAGQWIVNGYTMAAAVLMIFAGRCADGFGFKQVFLAGLSVFAIASLAVALSSGFWSIIIARIIQGACIAFTFPIATLFIRQVFPEEQYAYAVSLLISIAGISQAIGPAFGGFMISLLSWHWIFLINLPLSILAFVLIARYMDKQPSKGFNLDVAGLILLVVGLFLLMTALNEVNRLGFYSREFLLLIIISIVSLSLFIRKEMLGVAPLMELHLFFNHRYAIITATRFIVNFIYFSWLFGLGLLLQQYMDYSPAVTGLIMLILTLTITILATPVGVLIDKTGYRMPMLLGLGFMILTCLILAALALKGSVIFMIVALICGGIAIGLLIPSTVIGGMGSVLPERVGVAIGVFFTFGFLGNAFGVAIAGSLMGQDYIATGFRYAMLVDAVLAAIATIFCFKLPKYNAGKRLTPSLPGE